MHARKSFINLHRLFIYAFFVVGFFAFATETFAQIACSGLTSTVPSPNQQYKLTAFGCSPGFSDPQDNCLPAHGNPPEYCPGGMSGPDCERQIEWFAANTDIFGVWKKLLVTRPDTGKSVVVLTIDRGPNCTRERQFGPLLDVSYSAATYLGESGGNYETVTARPVPDDTPLGPTDGTGIPIADPGGVATGPNVSGNFRITLTARLKLDTLDTYIINRVNATATGGGSATVSGEALEFGDFDFPANPDDVSGIATEMASYAGGYTYSGHAEHGGLDVGVGPGKPIYAVADGQVTFARDSCYSGAGSSCRIEVTHSGDNYISSYTHVDVMPAFRQGANVTKGQQIATVADWAIPHLHFEMQSKNRQSSAGVGININPRNLFPVLQRWKSVYGPAGTGQEVRAHTASRGYPWANDGREYGNEYLNHPPCSGDPGSCWAH